MATRRSRGRATPARRAQRCAGRDFARRVDGPFMPAQRATPLHHDRTAALARHFGDANPDRGRGALRARGFHCVVILEGSSGRESANAQRTVVTQVLFGPPLSGCSSGFGRPSGSGLGFGFGRCRGVGGASGIDAGGVGSGVVFMANNSCGVFTRSVTRDGGAVAARMLEAVWRAACQQATRAHTASIATESQCRRARAWPSRHRPRRRRRRTQGRVTS